MHSIRRSEEMDITAILTDKLKAARLRRCNMIFDSFGPDHTDTIHLQDLVKALCPTVVTILQNSHLTYMHPDSANCLWLFFQAFRNQTKKEAMSRKYFTVNLLAALEKSKFNLHILFQDPDIIELEKRLRTVPTTPGNMSEQAKGRVNSRVSIEGTTTESTQRTDVPLQRPKDTSKDRSPIQSNRRDYSFRSNKKITGMRSIEERDSVLVSHESQRENQKKLQDYLKRHFETDLLDPHTQREISTSVLVNNVDESQILNISALGHKKVETTPIKRIPVVENTRSKSIPSTADIELGKCTFEPKLYKPMKSVVKNEVQSKIYDYMLKKNKFLNCLKASGFEGDTSFTRRQKGDASNVSPNKNADSFASLSRRSLPRNPSFEAINNISLINLGYAEAHNRKIEYAQQHLIPDYIELKTRRKSLEKQNPKPKPPTMVRTNSSAGFSNNKGKHAVKEVHVVLDSLTDKSPLKNQSMIGVQFIEKSQNSINIDESLEMRKRYHAFLRNEIKGQNIKAATPGLEKSNSRLSTHESNKAENSFHGGHYLPAPTFLYDPAKSNKKSNEKKGNRDVAPQKTRTPTGVQKKNQSMMSFQTKSINDSGLYDFNQNLMSRKDSKSKLDMPFKKSPSYHLKAEGPRKKGDQQINTDKENNYHFSFTEKDISQSHIC